MSYAEGVQLISKDEKIYCLPEKNNPPNHQGREDFV